MFNGDMRICDVCGEEIPKGETFKRSTMPAEKAAIFLDQNDPELIPSMTQKKSGDVEIDICQTCVLAMGKRNIDNNS
jgi:hypothetical protein